MAPASLGSESRSWMPAARAKEPRQHRMPAKTKSVLRIKAVPNPLNGTDRITATELCRTAGLRVAGATNWPTGKSFLIYVNHVKPQNKKYFALSEEQIRGKNPPVSPDKRGARDRHERGTGMRWTRKLRLTSAADAYGKDVWS